MAFTSNSFLKGVQSGGLEGVAVTFLCWWFSGLFLGLTNKRYKEESFLRQVLLTWIEMWQLAVRSNVLRYGVTFGLVGAAIMGTGYFLQYGSRQAFVAISNFGEGGFIVGGVIRIILNGFTAQMRADETLNRPNQGIWYSWKNSVRCGLISVVLGYGLELAFSAAIDGDTGTYGNHIVFSALIFAVVCGMGGWLLNGGMACVQHVILRWSLWRAGSTPCAYVRFLDYATHRHLLYKVGGGYMFTHRFLQEYFASLDTSAPLHAPSMSAAEVSASLPVDTSAPIRTPSMSAAGDSAVLSDYSVPTIAPTPPAPRSNASLCSDCGYELRSNAHFCSKCGAPVPS